MASLRNDLENAAYISRLKEELQELRHEETFLRAKLEKLQHALSLVQTPVTDVWCWEGSKNDQPSTLACPVVMSAEKLREMLQDVYRAAALENMLRLNHEVYKENLAKESVHRRLQERMTSFTVNDAIAKRDADGWSVEVGETVQRAHDVSQVFSILDGKGSNNGSTKEPGGGASDH